MADRILRDRGASLEDQLRRLYSSGLSAGAIADELEEISEGGITISYRTVIRWLDELGITAPGEELAI